MQCSPVVSVVMPNHNGARWLDEAIASVGAQTYPEWELIVVDDGSSDASLEKIRRWVARDPRITAIALAENEGISAARNIGIERARGEYVALLDSDDRMLPHRLEKQLRDFADIHRHGGLILQTDAYLINEKGERKGRYMPSLMRGKTAIGKDLRIDSAPSTWFFRRDLPIRFHPAWRVSEAGPFMEQILELGPIAYVDEPVSEYRVCLGSVSNRRGREMMKACQATGLTRASPEKWRNPCLPSQVREPPWNVCVNWVYGRSAKAALLNDRPLRASIYLVVALIARPVLTMQKLVQNGELLSWAKRRRPASV